jgi:hypothetical protein
MVGADRRAWAAMTVRRSAALHYHVETAIRKLLTYCEAKEWAGYDPYDALNSNVFTALPFLNSRVPRLVFTQVLKRSPINIRRLIGVPKTQNSKAIALFLAAFLKLSRCGMPHQEERAGLMIERLIALRSQFVPYWCWGYSFPWQTRTLLVAAGVPNLVCTCFVADALLDAYEHGYGVCCLNMAVSAAEYLINELYWTDTRSAAGFSYPTPSLRTEVHNANFLAAALLCRICKHTGDEKFKGPALRAARYSTAKQHTDGSWHYGESRSQRWIDNFHTGYNLCALQTISRYLETTEFEVVLRRGFEFYCKHFFREDGAVTYFHDRRYPIDAHCVAQSILTLLKLKELDPGNLALAHSVFQWALTHLWDDQGFFYYRVLRSCTIRVSYMRWSQAWMLLAMATLLGESKCDGLDEAGCGLAGVPRITYD